MSKDLSAPASAPASTPGSSSGRPFRRRVGGDVYLTSFPGDPDRLWLDAGFPVEGWYARPANRPNRPDFPGLPVCIRHGTQELSWTHDWWEVVATRLENDARGSKRCVYELRPWPEGQLLRQGFELTSESARRLTVQHRAVARQSAEAHRAALFMPFFGLISAAEQEEIESRHGLAPGRATVLTAMPILLISVYGVMLTIAASFGLGGSDVTLARDFRYLLLYLVVESAIRLGYGVLGNAMGSALVVVPLAVLRAMAPSKREEGSLETGLETLPAVPSKLRKDVAAWLEAVDAVKSLPPSPEGHGRLEILSPLPKEHWRAQVDLINYRDQAYVLEERQEIPGGHRFFLEVPTPGFRRTRRVHDYDPREVREIYKEQRRLKAEAWLETLAPLVGFTEPALQLELSEFTRYKTYRGVAQSIVFALLAGVLLLRTGWALAAGIDPADHLAFLGLGVFLVWENLVRAVRLARGEITPSFLGRLVSPLARRALRWRPDPSWPYSPTTSSSD